MVTGKESKYAFKKATFDHAWKYTEYDSSDTSGKTQYGAYGSAAVGDIDGDEKTSLLWLVTICNPMKHQDLIGQ